MTHFFYIIIHDEIDAFNIGVTNRVELLFNAVEKEFGFINKEKSMLYGSSETKLIENISNGCVAFLDSSYAKINATSETSNSWFKMDALNKLMTFLDLYLQEVSSFQFVDYYASWKEIEKSKNDSKAASSYDALVFLNDHSDAIAKISSWIIENKEDLEFIETSNIYSLKGAETEVLNNLEAPLFKWFDIEANEVKFNLNTFKDWTESGIEESMRGLVEIKFFDKFSLKNLDVMFNHED